MLIALLLILATAAEPDPVADALASELDRAMTELATASPAPYFLSAELFDHQGLSMVAEDGALHDITPSHYRLVDVDVRVGSPELDSTHALRAEREGRPRSGQEVPLTDDPALIRRALWQEIDNRFRAAQARWAKVQAEADVLVAEDSGLDLAPVPPVVASEPLVSAPIDPDVWAPILRTASDLLAEDAVVRDGSVRLDVSADNSWFVSSEGSRIRQGRVEYSVTAKVDTLADDGTSLRLSQRWSGRSPDKLPSAEQLRTSVAELHDLLAALRVAPELEPYTGPAILSDRAAGVFFHEIFGHRVEGHRLKRIDNAQTFKDLVEQPILPSFLSVYDDPTLDSYAGHDLRGSYHFDNQGVATSRVTLVQDGVLKGFLESRSPSGPQAQSNGHGRRERGLPAVTRQGNLLVESTSQVSNQALRAALRKEAKAQGLAFGLLVDDIQGGFTFTQRGTPNAFNINVLVAHKVFVDGRPDVLVRGVDMIGTPLQTFGRITLAGELHEVFNGSCGAESGWVPVSATSPALLISQIETQRKAKGQQTPPLLPAPGKHPHQQEGS